MAGSNTYVTIITIFFFLSFYFTCAESESFECDHSFGDPNWEYSHIYYNQTHILRSGTKKLEVTLPRNSGEMISFVCVRTPSLPHETSAAFASISGTVTVTARTPVYTDTAVQVVAKKHGY